MQNLSEDFIREFQNKKRFSWSNIPKKQKLSEDFIEEFQDKKLNWIHISANQKLSEDFIRKFKNKVDWCNVSYNQKLSEDFMREFQDKISWFHVSYFQNLSEDFMREFQDKIYWYHISIKQKLSEDFIREFKDKVDWDRISKYQKLSKEFREEFNITPPENFWLYKSTEEKEKYIRENTDYEIVDGKIIAYKSCRSDGYSKYNFHFHYENGKEYESHANHDPSNKNSFGLSAWTKNKAIKYCDEKLFKVEIAIEDVACIVHGGNKIRATKLKIVDEIINFN
jgi:hypothetical protein